MPVEDIAFHNRDITLRGSLIIPETAGPYPLLIETHTSHAGTRDFGAYQHLAHVLPAVGVAVFLYDRRGCGESNGNFANATFFDLASDVQAAVDTLRNREDIDARHIGVWGMSQGGWIAPLAAASSADVTFVIAVSSAGVSPAEQMNFSAAYALKEAGFSAWVIEQMLELRRQVDAYYRGAAPRNPVQALLDKNISEPWFGLSYLDEKLPEDPQFSKWCHEMDFDPCAMMRGIRAPVLLLYGEIDPWVPIAESAAIWMANGPEAITMRRVKGANHFMVSIADSGTHAFQGPQVEEYTSILTHWIQMQVG